VRGEIDLKSGQTSILDVFSIYGYEIFSSVARRGLGFFEKKPHHIP